MQNRRFAAGVGNLPMLGKIGAFLPNLGKIAAAGALCGLLGFALPLPASAAVRSPAGRFRVAGETTPEAVALALALDEISSGVAAATGLAYPESTGPIVQVFLPATAEESSRAPSSLARFQDGALYQRLLLGDPRATPDAALAEGAAALLAVRYAASTLPRAERRHAIPVAPDWLSCGLARVLTPSSRAEVRRFVKSDMAAHEPPALSDIVSRTALPAGAWAEKMYAAEAVRFLFPEGDAAVWRALFSSLARGGKPTPAWLRDHCPALARGRVEATWKAYLSGLARERLPADFSAAEDLKLDDELDEILEASPRDTLSDPRAPASLSHASLVAARRDEWVPSFARAKALAIRMLATRAADPGLGEALAAYAKFFDTLSRPPEVKKSFWKSEKAEIRAAEAAWETGLEVTWNRAEALRSAYRDAASRRSRYVDLFDLPAAPLPAPDASSARSAVSAYVDRFAR